jgi:hypothetical protein
VSFYDLPAKAQADFDYIDGEDRYSRRLFQYGGVWYDVNEFERLPENGHSFWKENRANWNGYQSDSFFSGVLVRFTEDYERVVAGRYYS